MEEIVKSAGNQIEYIRGEEAISEKEKDAFIERINNKLEELYHNQQGDNINNEPDVNNEADTNLNDTATAEKENNNAGRDESSGGRGTGTLDVGMAQENRADVQGVQPESNAEAQESGDVGNTSATDGDTREESGVREPRLVGYEHESGGQIRGESDTSGADKQQLSERSGSERSGDGRNDTLGESGLNAETAIKPTTDDEAAKNAEKAVARNKNNLNYSKNDELKSYIDGNKPKMRDNADAIKLLKQLEREDRLPNAEERVTLAKFKGWGGLSSELSYYYSVKKLYDRR